MTNSAVDDPVSLIGEKSFRFTSRHPSMLLDICASVAKARYSIGLDFLSDFFWSIQGPKRGNATVSGKLIKVQPYIEYGNFCFAEVMDVLLNDGYKAKILDNNVTWELEMWGKGKEFEISFLIRDIQKNPTEKIGLQSASPKKLKSTWVEAVSAENRIARALRSTSSDHNYFIYGKVIETKNDQATIDFGSGNAAIPLSELTKRGLGKESYVFVQAIHENLVAISETEKVAENPWTVARIVEFASNPPTGQRILAELDNGVVVGLSDDGILLEKDRQAEMLGRWIEVEIQPIVGKIEKNQEKLIGVDCENPIALTGTFYGMIKKLNSPKKTVVLDFGLGEFEIEVGDTTEPNLGSYIKANSSHLKLLSIRVDKDSKKTKKTKFSPITKNYTNLETALKEPEKVWKLSLNDKNLSSLPEEATLFKELRIANLSNNSHLDFADCLNKICHSKKLVSLKLSNNKLNSLPRNITKVNSITSLNLENNSLITIPSEINKLQQLEELTISGNKLLFLPPEIGSLKKLRKLNLRYNLLTQLPIEIGNLINLEELLLGGNQLTTLPSTIGRLRRLRVLELRDNGLQFEKANQIMSYGLREKISPSLWNYEWRKANIFISLPVEIGNLQNLEELILASNNFNEGEIERIKKILPNCKVTF